MQGAQVVLHEKAQRLIGVTARRLSRSGYFSAQDRRDLEQELVLTLLQKWPGYGPTRSPWPAYLWVVVTTRACSLRRDRKARKLRNRAAKPANAKPETGYRCRYHLFEVPGKKSGKSLSDCESIGGRFGTLASP